VSILLLFGELLNEAVQEFPQEESKKNYIYGLLKNPIFIFFISKELYLKNQVPAKWQIH
jgi:hypothetical protein